ncbi:hypothetical protein [Nocardioides daejeonensis]|uniref:hypothetical protein n=1 Tax=Nocardioides daejeonensis TaxID=1046556 RepID=UPI0013A5A288|nr:hypothetical protein [Nocardioides daejeonensis]
MSLWRRAWQGFGAPPRGRRVAGTVWVFGLGAAAGAAASVWTVHTGSNLDYGDAMAHLTISRRILDSMNPGLQQLGTVWLPLPHLLLLPFVMNLWLFKTGVAACIVGSLCLGTAAASLHRIMARIGIDGLGRLVGLAILLTNLSLLYACTTALTEPVLIATLTTCVAGLAGWATSERRLSGGELAVFAGIPAGMGVLTRYEAWALVVSGTIFVAFVCVRRGETLRRTAAYCASFLAVPATAIGWWLAYNTAWYGNPVEFLTGDYSAAAFTEVFIEQGQLTTKGNLGLSFQVLSWAILETSGVVPLLLAGAGLVVLTIQRGIDDRALVVWLLGTSTAFLLFSLTTGQHIMVNDRSLPTGAYNNRYVLSAVPWVAVLAAYLVGQWRAAAAARTVATVLIGAGLAWQVVWWGDAPEERMTVIQEGREVARAAAETRDLARWLGEHYDGGRILLDESAGNEFAFQPLVGVPLSDYYNRSSGDHFDEALADPFGHVRWVVMHRAQLVSSSTKSSVDLVTEALSDDPQFHARYELVHTAGNVGIYRRIGGDT